MPFGPGGGAGTGGGGAAPVVLDPPAVVNITIAGLASGAARQSDYIANTNQRAHAKVTFQCRTGAVAPTNGTIVELWLLRTDYQSLVGLFGDDGTGPSDAPYPVPPTLPRNATLIGSLSVTANAIATFKGTFFTDGVLGDFFGFAVVNRTDQALDPSGNTIIIETF